MDLDLRFALAPETGRDLAIGDELLLLFDLDDFRDDFFLGLFATDVNCFCFDWDFFATAFSVARVIPPHKIRSGSKPRISDDLDLWIANKASSADSAEDVYIIFYKFLYFFIKF